MNELLEPVLVENGFELVEVVYRTEGRGRVLRIFLDKDGGINIDDCTKVSRELGALLDVYEVIGGEYTLEVSSPGLRRPLKRPADFMRFRGRKVKIKTTVDIDERSIFVGKLLGFAENVITVEVDGGGHFIPMESIKWANLEPDF
ncbi:MAG: ribosome maturation factor RimP [Thermodesulfobacteriota bacterium]